jgi:hypothetical protein
MRDRETIQRLASGFRVEIKISGFKTDVSTTFGYSQSTCTWLSLRETRELEKIKQGGKRGKTRLIWYTITEDFFSSLRENKRKWELLSYPVSFHFYHYIFRFSFTLTFSYWKRIDYWRQPRVGCLLHIWNPCSGSSAGCKPIPILQDNGRCHSSGTDSGDNLVC